MFFFFIKFCVLVRLPFLLLHQSQSSSPGCSSIGHIAESGESLVNYHVSSVWLKLGCRERGAASVLYQRACLITPQNLQGLASTSRGRRTQVALEIRTALEQIRKEGNLRLQVVMLLNQSMVLGGADRYRDMRVDVDNMT